MRLEAEPDIAVVGEAGSAEEAVALVERTAPDVAVVDLNPPGVDGVELIRRLAVAAPHVATLMLTMLSDDSVTAAVRAGARGYLLKDAEPGRIVAAVRAVAAGESVFSGAVAAQLLGGLAAPQPGRTVFPELTAREHEILELLAAGLTNAEIGRRLALRPRPCATTSRTYSPRSTPPTGRTRCCAPAGQGWVEGERSRRAVQPDHADRDVLQTAAVEVAPQLVGFDRGSQPVERTVSIDLAGLRVDGEHDITVALRELLGGGDEGRVVRNWVVRHRITSWSPSTALPAASA
jgi:DNA-binding NarL/FixJ family response regulator